MSSSLAILGFDVGSVCVHFVGLNYSGDIVYRTSKQHEGEVKQTILSLLKPVQLEKKVYIATTDATPSFIKTNKSYDDQLTLVRTAKFFHHQFDAILHIGGEKFSLSRFDANLNYIGVNHNTSCAAGTGSFLDQQALRLNLLGGSQELSQKAISNSKKIPQIATRCAVFAKTDLIHAQQEGYGIEQICDGLCHGLAKNISNTLFKNKNIGSSILFCGGVSHNLSVKNHLETITGYQFVIDDHSKFYGAIGAALCLLDDIGDGTAENKIISKKIVSNEDIFIVAKKEDALLYPPLSLTLSRFPDFNSVLSYTANNIEADVYQDPDPIEKINGFLGLDVGSTSTKSILIDQNGNPVVGFYTKTASRPVEAVQKIFKAYDQFFEENSINVKIKGCGTTGSGRRISAKIIGADIEPDEITAHATAAYHLNPKVDTIIEIGGQDAKFTLLKDGMVTSSTMNTVCAAGTGSFIEEQALKLGCPLSEYSQRAEEIKAPMASDRCTVFMERDLNYYFAQGYKKNEVLASVLHSVRDNYLTKVAAVANIGDCILFQGATAKNKALVAAFEQKLNKQIHVSKYCHLTGALGVALMVKKEIRQSSSFKGFQIWNKNIPIRQEVCELCQNHCKLTIAEMDDQTLAYGFLCGRDYTTQKMIPKKSSYDLIRARKKCVPKFTVPTVKHNVTIGIPKALHLFEDYEFWQSFFSTLGVKTIHSQGLENPVKVGKSIANAEFCAPVMSLHGHIKYLSQKADYVFLPFYFEEKSEQKDRRRQHCYYTQFTPSVLSCVPGIEKEKLLSPIIKYLYTSFHTKLELYKCLKKISANFSFFNISAAYDKAIEVKKQITHNHKKLFNTLKKDEKKLNIVFLGRPYTVLTNTMNNNIPQIFQNLGTQTFFQDMLDEKAHNFSSIDPLLKEIHWKHADSILKAAYICATTDNLYPVYISSFRCAPDSFGIEYFKQIMESHNKPYLVLELDEHDSSVGYETRVEAAVRAFTNHKNSPQNCKIESLEKRNPHFIKKIEDKTIIFPNWDAYAGALIVSVFKNEGYKAVLMEETQDTLKKSILTNTGQCIPLNAIAAGFIHTVEKNHLDPANCVLWLNISDIACNIKLYPYHIQKILTQNGNGFEKASIYKGELTLFDISYKASTNAYFAYMFGGLLRSIGCKIRPYEIHKGTTDRTLNEALNILCLAFEKGESKETALKSAMALIGTIEKTDGLRPKVGIFGDLYVRDNDIMNQGLIRFIEENGGEVITTPYYKYLKIVANSYFKKWFKEGKYISLISNGALLVAMQTMEKRYYKYFEPVLDASEFSNASVGEESLKEYGIKPEHTGESMDNILKIHYLVNEHPDLKLLVQTNPAFCCPGLITEAMGQKLEKKTGVPIVSITYDVSGGNKNKVIIPFLKNKEIKNQSQSLKVSV